jgi:hypothetical protein
MGPRLLLRLADSSTVDDVGGPAHRIALFRRQPMLAMVIVKDPRRINGHRTVEKYWDVGNSFLLL